MRPKLSSPYPRQDIIRSDFQGTSIVNVGAMLDKPMLGLFQDTRRFFVVVPSHEWNDYNLKRIELWIGNDEE